MQFSQNIHGCCPSGCFECITAEQASGVAASVKIVTWRSTFETEQESMPVCQRCALSGARSGEKCADMVRAAEGLTMPLLEFPLSTLEPSLSGTRSTPHRDVQLVHRSLTFSP